MSSYQIYLEGNIPAGKKDDKILVSSKWLKLLEDTIKDKEIIIELLKEEVLTLNQNKNHEEILHLSK